MLSASSSTPLRPWGTTSYSLLNGFVTPFQRGGDANTPNSATPRARSPPLNPAEYRKVLLAGVYMRAAVTPGRSIQHLTTMEALKALRRYYSFASQALIWTALLGLILLTFFEDGPSALPPSVTLSVEFAFLWVLAMKMMEKHRFLGHDMFSKDASSIIHLCLIIALFLDFCVGLFPHPSYVKDGEDRFHRYGRALRPFLIMDHAPSVRHRLQDLIVAGWRARTTFLLVTFNVIFFSVLATVLFHNISPDDPGYDNFADLGSSLVTLIILQTTSNSPDVFVPFFYESRSSSLFFITFLIMSHFLLLNLMLGVVYHEHSSRLRIAAYDELLDSYTAARAAMAVLADDVGTNKDAYECDYGLTVKMLSHEFKMSEATAKRLLFKCGASVDGVNREQFTRLPKAVVLRMSSFHDVIDDSYDELDDDDENGCKSAMRRRVRHCLQIKFSHKFTLVDTFVVSSLIVMLTLMIRDINIDFEAFLESEGDGFVVDIYSRAFWSAILTFAFGIELCLKLFAYGIFRFSDDMWNVFDSICVILSLIGVQEVFHAKASVLLTEARMLRLLRIVPGFRSVVGTAAAFAPAVGPSIAAIMCIFFTTAVLVSGVLGQVRLSDEDYKANDFRDFSAALVTLFQLSIVNDWNSTMAAFVKATGSTAVRSFFIGWWAISQLLLFNTVTSLVLDGFEVRMRELNALKTDFNENKPYQLGDNVGESHRPSVHKATSREYRDYAHSAKMSELKQLNLLRSLSDQAPMSIRGVSGGGDDNDSRTDDNASIAPLLRGTSFTVGRMFLELFRDIEEPTNYEVDLACWERGVRVGKSPYDNNNSNNNEG